MAKNVSRKELAARTRELPEVVRYLRVSRMGDRVLHSEEFHSPELQITAIDREPDRPAEALRGPLRSWNEMSSLSSKSPIRATVTSGPREPPQANPTVTRQARMVWPIRPQWCRSGRSGTDRAMASTEHNPENIWVVHDLDSESWHVRREGEDAPLETFATQDEAFQAGRDAAKDDQVELIVQGADGKIVEKNSYGQDPRDVKG